MTTGSAWFSDHPDVLAWYERLQAADASYRERLDALGAEYPGYELMVVKNRHAHHPVGLKGATIPAEQLWGRREWFWVPSKATKAGKELAARFDACALTIEPKPGMPSECWVPKDICQFSVRSPGMFGSASGVWVHWDVGADALRSPDDMRRDVVDETIWTLRKLSEYHAAREERELLASGVSQ